MPSPDKLFRLDPVETKITAPVSHIKAQTGPDISSIRRSRVRGREALASAIGSLAELKKQERIKEDVDTAAEAAAREEVMPGGLLPIAQQKYKDVVDINTSHAIALEAENYLEGDEWGATIQNPDWTSRQKTDHLRNTLGEMKVRGMASIQNPTVLQKLNLSFDEKLAEAERKVYEVEKDQQTLQIIQGQKNVIKDAKGFAKRTGVSLTETFTANFINNMATDTLAIAPWMSKAEAKILTFKNLVSDPDILGETSVINEIMKEEFSKGFTYNSLLLGKGEDSNEFKNVYTQWLSDSKAHFDKIDKDNTALSKKRVTNANKAVMDHLENGGSADDATEIAKQHGITSIPAVNKIQKAATKYEDNIKLGFDTQEGRKLLEQILLNNITDPNAVKIYMLDNGFDLKSFSEYEPYISLEDTQRKTALDKYIKAIRTINTHAASMFKKALNFDVPIDLETGKIDRDLLMASLFEAGINQDRVLEAMSALQSIRDYFDSQAVIGAKKAAIENTDPDLQSYRSEYEKQIAQVIDNLQQGEPPFGKSPASTKADFVDTGVTPEPVDKPIERYDRTSALVHSLPEFVNIETKEVTEFLKDPEAITEVDRDYIDKISKENPEALRQAVIQKAIKQLPDSVVKQLDNELDKFSSINTIGFTARELEEQLKKIPKEPIVEKDTRNFFQKLDQRFDNVIDFLKDASIFPDKPAIKQEISSTKSYLDIFTDIISPSEAEGVEIESAKPVETSVVPEKKIDGKITLTTKATKESLFSDEHKLVRKDLQPEVTSKVSRYNKILNDVHKTKTNKILDILSGLEDKGDSLNKNKFIHRKGDPKGVYTAMYGVTHKTANSILGTNFKKGDLINHGQASEVVDQLAKKANEEIDEILKDSPIKLTENQRIVLSLLSHNVGPLLTKFPEAMKALKNGNLTTAKKELFSKAKGPNKVGGKFMEGLFKKNNILLGLFEGTGE